MQLLAENEKFKNDNEMMRKAIEELRKKLSEAMAIAKKKGLGDEMEDLVANAGLNEFISGVSRAKVYHRLYDDAVNRRARLAEMIDKARQTNANNLARVEEKFKKYFGCLHEPWERMR